jgi:hypothetical protein
MPVPAFVVEVLNGAKHTEQTFELPPSRPIANDHPIGARTTSVCLDSPQCFSQVLPFTNFLRQSIHADWAFGAIPRRERFSLFPPRFAGFSRRRGEVQSGQNIPLPVIPETFTDMPETLSDTRRVNILSTSRPGVGLAPSADATSEVK